MRLAALVSIVFLILTWLLLAQESPPPGRYLPDGTYQARNTRATLTEAEYYPSNPFDIATLWGTDLRLSYTEGLKVHDPKIAASGNNVYVVWWEVDDQMADLARSTDLGETWLPQVRISDTLDNYVGLPQIIAEDSCIYIIYTVGSSRVFLVRSLDWGLTWSRVLVYGRARYHGGGPTIASKANRIYCLFSILVDYVPPQNTDLFLYRSRDYGETWPDTFFVSDTTYAGIPPELASNCREREPDPVLHLIRQKGTVTSAQEIFYQRSTDGGETWLGPAMISHHDTISSQWPQIAAWGDSFVVATWMDYKYSGHSWLGDAFFSKSRDNGESWSEPVSLSPGHRVKSCDIASFSDTLVLTYQEGVEGPGEVFARVSFDGGESWLGVERLSDDISTYRLEPTVAISGGLAHVAWSDARDHIQSIFEIYYDHTRLDTGSVAIWEEGEGEPLPEGITLRAYPNPFNSSTIITLSGMEEAEIAIYDITGRRLDILQAHDGRAVWEVSSLSSGVYFARVLGEGSGRALRLVLVR